jgi:predicted P-loop ATPase
VIVGSTNQTQFLTDATGDRRFWVVQTTRIDTEALRRDRDQLWAEAVDQYCRGYGWWLGADAERAREEATETHRVADPWEDAVAPWLASLSPHEARGLTTQRLLTGACGVELERIGTRESARIAQIMRRLGWEQKVLRLAGRSTRVWQPIETP